MSGATGDVRESGKERQRRRTRAAIVAAATELLRSGHTPSLSEVADAADVSRRTVYLYFPTVEQLLLDATVGMLSETAIDEAIDRADADGDATARVTAMIRAFSEQAADTLPLGRSLIRLTVGGSDHQAGSPVRGYRRVGWIERAVEPLRPSLDDATYERLVSALAMVVGWEALVVLSDIRGLDPDEQAATSLWAARALIAAALDDTTG